MNHPTIPLRTLLAALFGAAVLAGCSGQSSSPYFPPAAPKPVDPGHAVERVVKSGAGGVGAMFGSVVGSVVNTVTDPFFGPINKRRLDRHHLADMHRMASICAARWTTLCDRYAPPHDLVDQWAYFVGSYGPTAIDAPNGPAVDGDAKTIIIIRDATADGVAVTPSRAIDEPMVTAALDYCDLYKRERAQSLDACLAEYLSEK